MTTWQPAAFCTAQTLVELVPQLPVGSLHIQRGYLNTEESGGDTVHCSKVSVGSRVTEKPNRQKAGTYEVSNEPSGLGHSTNFPGYILLLTPVQISERRSSDLSWTLVN